MQNFTMDGITYRVTVVYGSLHRAFTNTDGDNAGTAITGKYISDSLGTGYRYTMDVEPDYAHPADYDAFYDAVSAPVASHRVSFPYGQDTLEFDARIHEGEDAYNGKLAGFNRWTGLRLEFTPLSLQRRI